MSAPSRSSNGLRRFLAAAALLGGMAGCAEFDLERGFSARDAEWARAHAPSTFSVVSASHDRAVVSALGQQVAVEPADGFCLATGAIETSDRSAFLLLGDCALEEQEGSDPGDGPLELPPGVPGIITVSISGDPGFSRFGGGSDLSDLQAFVETADGRALLGRGGDGDEVAVADTRRIGDSLYVLVEDADGSVPVLAPRFWRAFVELNDRLTVVTISGFRDGPLSEDEMLRYLGDQVRQLQVANSEPIDEAPVQVADRGREHRGLAWPSFAAPRTEAEAIEGGITDRAPAITDLKPTSIIVSTEAGGQSFLPVPSRRRAGNGAETPARASEVQRPTTRRP